MPVGAEECVSGRAQCCCPAVQTDVPGVKDSCHNLGQMCPTQGQGLGLWQLQSTGTALEFCSLILQQGGLGLLCHLLDKTNPQWGFRLLDVESQRVQSHGRSSSEPSQLQQTLEICGYTKTMGYDYSKM